MIGQIFQFTSNSSRWQYRLIPGALSDLSKVLSRIYHTLNNTAVKKALIVFPSVPPLCHIDKMSEH